MTNRSKAIGTKTESDVVRWITPRGLGGADETSKAQRITLHGADDQGDVSFCPGVMAEVKGGKAAEGASDAQIETWLVDTERERVNRGADVAVLVLKRKGKGAANAGQWWTFLPGWAFCYLADYATGCCNGLAADYVELYLPVPAVRITLADAVTLLRRAGYGDPL